MLAHDHEVRVSWVRTRFEGLVTYQQSNCVIVTALLKNKLYTVVVNDVNTKLRLFIGRQNGIVFTPKLRI